MPIQRCGKGGYKYGRRGKCYTGKNGKRKAIRQGLAISRNSKEKFKP